MKLFLLLAVFAGAFANPKYPDICGLENKPSSDERIVGGKEAARNQFPWLAAITAEGYCTGSILDEDWIITAAHCVKVDKPAWVRVGIHNRENSSEPHMQERESKEIYTSPHGDFALIKVAEPIELNDYVRPVCIPTRADMENTFVGVNATLTGWGVNSFDDFKANYPELYYYKGIPIAKCSWPDNILCTDSNIGVAVCFGDSGGPINYEFKDGKYMQIGVNQFVSSSTCVGGFNGYARFTSHLDFVQETTGIVIE